jgi:hypothetical protein
MSEIPKYVAAKLSDYAGRQTRARRSVAKEAWAKFFCPFGTQALYPSPYLEVGMEKRGQAHEPQPIRWGTSKIRLFPNKREFSGFVRCSPRRSSRLELGLHRGRVRLPAELPAGGADPSTGPA